MRRPRRKRITTRVVVLSIFGTALLVAALVSLIVAVDGQRDASRSTFRSQELLTAGSQLESSLISIENGLRGFVASDRRQFLEPAQQALDDFPAELRQVRRLLAEDSEGRNVGPLLVNVENYITLWARPLLALYDTDPDRARSAVLGNGGRARLAVIQAGFARLFTAERRVIATRQDRAESRSSTAIGFGIGGIALLLVVVATLAWYLRRAVVAPLVEVGEATAQIAEGDLEAMVPDPRDDEIGDLGRSFNAMARSLDAGRTELDERRDELERSNAELSRSNSELEQFASVTSHDLQAPLVTISMYAELLRRRQDERGEDAELIDGIRGATVQARTLIRDLLEYSRAGRGALETEAVDTSDLVHAVLDAMAGAVADAGATVEIEELPIVQADRGNLSRVLQNLLGNAIKFTAGATAPRVLVGADREGAEWRFWVRDNGIGMEPEHARRIFEPFQRLHGEDAYPGSGIGLAVCERIVSQHGGRIWVTAEPGAGAEFSFTLPAAAERETANV